VDTNSIPKVISINKDTGVTIYQDADGGMVLSGLEVPITATKEQQQTHKTETVNYENNSKNLNEFNAYLTSSYVDYENNPIYIGTWNGARCYARHTLGAYSSSTKYLTSYGYTSWYNVSGNNALPYRNGATNDGANQGVVDVAKFSNFSIRDLGTDNATTLQVTDWGPSQDSHPDRVADIDKNIFTTLHGNYTDGTFYSRTYVPITNYNP
jgi:hypothetical protein